MTAKIPVLQPIAAHARVQLALPVFALTLFLSAFLLFSVQPFFAKMVLPRLGGSPGVWSVAMVFFQSMLLLGYGYAHLLTARLSLKHAALVHLAVMAIAFIFLPIAIPQGWSEPPQTGQTLWLLGLFTVAVGLPFFAVSANGPLLQAWFSRTGHHHAADPYFLYGASNIGSFASLILYIVAFEPMMSVPQQSISWAAGFALLALAIAACAIIAFRSNGEAAIKAPARTALPSNVDWAMRLRWVGLAAVPSGLLVAVTAHVSMDIAAAPFLWVVPLALFLLTFVLAFAQKPLFSIGQLSAVLPPLAAFVFITMVFGSAVPIWASLIGHLGYFFLAALLAHSVLVSLRPASNELTAFYFWMSLGGVIGGAFTALLSPVMFNWIAEYPLLILAALACRPQVWTSERREMRIMVLLGLLAAVLLNNPLIATFMPIGPGFYAVAIAGFAAAAALVRYRSEAMHLMFAILVGGLFFASQATTGNLSLDRSFFGVVKAFTSPDGRFTIMAHGTTEHGAMRNSERGAKPTPITYYHESGGIALALFARQEMLAGRPAQMGAVGLGAGAILCHRQPGETWTSYEIDQAVVDAAANPALFGFVPQCGNGDPVIIGDARLMLAKEPAAKFDYLLIDAFSSDSIPVHLLTTEAIELYRDKLAHDGFLVIHISNRFMELKSVVSAIAARTGMAGRFGRFDAPDALKSGEHVNPSEVVVLARSEAALGAVATDTRWSPLDPGTTAAWTDDYSNVLAAILRSF
jgi:hypothetical protein